MIFSFTEATFLFIIFSIIGWICDTTVVSLWSKEYINRGFLFGPYCPSYGAAMVLILALTANIRAYIPVVFLICIVVAFLLEILTGWLYEVLFLVKWRGHDPKKYRFKDSFSIVSTLLTGVLATAFIYLLYPHLDRFVDWFAPVSLRVMGDLIIALFILDMIFSIIAIIDIRTRLSDLSEFKQTLSSLNKKYAFSPSGEMTYKELEALSSRYPHKREISRALYKYADILDVNFNTKHILKAFPRMAPLEYMDEIDILRQERCEYFGTCPVSHGEVVTNDDANLGQRFLASYKNVNLTRLIWLFFIGCIAGYVIETMYTLLHNAYFESRQGMLYGPFSQVYGFGAVIMVLLLDPISKKKTIWLFLFSAVVGGVFEAGVGWLQEIMFGTTSWDYSDSAFSMFGGRTSLIYMLCWGILGTFFMRVIYPKVVNFVERIPRNPRRFFTVIIAFGLAINLILSGFAVFRWGQRQQDIPPANAVESLVDSHYNDSYMKEVYPHMKVH